MAVEWGEEGGEVSFLHVGGEKVGTRRRRQGQIANTIQLIELECMFKVDSKEQDAHALSTHSRAACPLHVGEVMAFILPLFHAISVAAHLIP